MWLVGWLVDDDTMMMVKEHSLTSLKSSLRSQKRP